MQRTRIYLRPVVVLFLFSCIIGQSVAEAKAANISNNWTLPQEGFSVFYRFFRDKISWFEADAVCQFHHGSLVTVNNGIQFDSTRAFLRELDVSDTVWIGLKGSAGSSRFTWANSQPLDNNAGYWAESFPATENPLCAAIDPTRNFRWHALNCNGPSTSAFLCELPVPDWGSHCTVTAMPSVTIQYLSDEAAIRLSRDCGDEEGERHVLCRAGEDRATVLSQLVCNNVASAASAYSSTEGDSYATSDEALYTTATEEDYTTTTTTKSSMDMAINKIVTEIQSIATNDSLNGELEPLKPRKQPKKFNPLAEKKLRPFKKAGKTVSQAERSLTTDRTDATETLPHIKRMRPEDYKRSDAVEADAEVHSREERVRRETLNIPQSTGATATEAGIAAIMTTAMEEETLFIANYTEDSLSSSSSSSSSSATTSSSGVDGNLDWNNRDENVTEEENELSAASESLQLVSSTVPSETLVTMIEISGTPHSAQPKGSITHPMHISSDMTKELLDAPPAVQEQPATKTKKDKEKVVVANQQDHFVPPMLLVKAKFTPGKQHIDAQENLTTFDGEPHPAEIQHTIESPIMETTNDISKFYPASTEKTMIAEKPMLVEIPEPAANITSTTVAPLTFQSSTEAASTMTVLTSSTAALAEAITETTESPVTISTTTQEAATKEAPRSEFSFTNIENYQPYRPNRRRSLTKPASRSYLRRILG